MLLVEKPNTHMGIWTKVNLGSFEDRGTKHVNRQIEKQ